MQGENSSLFVTENRVANYVLPVGSWQAQEHNLFSIVVGVAASCVSRLRLLCQPAPAGWPAHPTCSPQPPCRRWLLQTCRRLPPWVPCCRWQRTDPAARCSARGRLWVAVPGASQLGRKSPPHLRPRQHEASQMRWEGKPCCRWQALACRQSRYSWLRQGTHPI